MRVIEIRRVGLAGALVVWAAIANAGAGDDGAAPQQPQAPGERPADRKPDETAPPEGVKTAPEASAARNGNGDGFVLQFGGNDNQLTFGMVAQEDGRFSPDDPKPITNTFTLRKLRPTFTGRVAKYFDFKVMPDFGNGTTVVQDAYFDIRFSRAFRIRFGKNKTPVGYELLQGDAFLLFPERALASSLVPNRDIGLQAQGDLAGGKLSYAAGIFNGVPDGTTSTTELDTNNRKDFAGRIVVQPFLSASAPDAVANGLGFHIGGSSGRQSGPLPSFKTSVGQTYFSYKSGAVADGSRHRLSPAVFYYYKSLGVFGEYMWSKQAVSGGGPTTDVSNHAWDVTASFLLTGEAASYNGVRPKQTFDPAHGHWGALQVLGRYTRLTVDARAFTAGLAAAGASREAKSFTIAINWYPSAYIKHYVTYERTVFDSNVSGSRPPENVILYRAQLAF